MSEVVRATGKGPQEWQFFRGGESCFGPVVAEITSRSNLNLSRPGRVPGLRSVEAAAGVPI